MAGAERSTSHSEDRATSFSQNGLRHAAGQGVRDPPASVGAHDDEVARQALG